MATAGRRRRPGTAEPPEEARGRLPRKLLALYDQHRPFRQALRRLADEHLEAVAELVAERIDLEFGPARGRAASSPAVAAYVAALEGFAERWGLARLPDGQGLDALHAWCLLTHASGGAGGLAFGVGHLVSSLPAGVDTIVRLGDFVDLWDPDEEPLTDHEIPIPDRDAGLVDSSDQPVPLGALYGWRMHQRVEGAKTRLREAAERAKGWPLTPDEAASLEAQLARIEAESAAVGHVHPDTAPEEGAHLRWAFLRLAPAGPGGQPMGVWQIALAEGADEKTVRNATDRLRRRLGIDRFPKVPRKPEHGPRSKPRR